jgi:hypothetical protein
MMLRRAGTLGLAVCLLALAGCTVTITTGDETWTVDCADVAQDDCEGIARMFINNLARNGGWVHDESGGRINVARAQVCPQIPEWGVPGDCWRVAAPTQTSRACMLMARRKELEQGYAFRWIGGDELTGSFSAPKPGTTPC